MFTDQEILCALVHVLKAAWRLWDYQMSRHRLNQYGTVTHTHLQKSASATMNAFAMTRTTPYMPSHLKDRNIELEEGMAFHYNSYKCIVALEIHCHLGRNQLYRNPTTIYMSEL